MEFVFSQLFKNMNDDDRYITEDKSCNIKYIEKVNGELRIEAIDRRFPMVVKDNVAFRKVGE
ncbi:hypothetical protein [uncultured Clostridium sp.]|uniref:hypothetical protein n=1 Tax=uncultured Clostridium sp. TaxID=59620 RepID=UPI0032162A8D